MTGDPPAHDRRADERDVTKPLSYLVRDEARRMLSERQLRGDPARLADGWERRFIADGERAEESVRLYEELGYEVCADPIQPEDLGDDCEDCQLVARLNFKTIYTRRKLR